MHLIKQRLKNAFQLTENLLESFTNENLQLKIPNVPSNSIGGQFWCIIGARQSYMNAIRNGGVWQGFKCDLDNPHSKDEVHKLLRSTTEELEALDIDETNPEVLEKLITLLEHEIQHHGQLIRFVYSNKLKFPESWNKRYTV